ncbi:hypothetical protein EV360DRAFT_73001 [Lentinula raphanica]|nr:hypothetical protein EV360DRAFT_73001 [Lentinula raphanica]
MIAPTVSHEGSYLFLQLWIVLDTMRSINATNLSFLGLSLLMVSTYAMPVSDTKLPTMNVQARATTEADVPEGAEIWYISSDFTAEERKFVEAGERWAALHKENWGLPAKFVILPHPKMKAREEIEGKASTILPEFCSRKSPDFGSTILDVTLQIPWQGDTSETRLSMHSYRSKETVVIGGTVPQQNWWNRLLGHWQAPRLKENKLTFDKDYDGNIVVVERMPVEEKKKNKDGYVRL